MVRQKVKNALIVFIFFQNFTLVGAKELPIVVYIVNLLLLIQLGFFKNCVSLLGLFGYFIIKVLEKAYQIVLTTRNFLDHF